MVNFEIYIITPKMSTSTQNYAKMNSNPETGISICIPRVFNNIGWRRIKQTFIDLQWGFVERVDVIPKGEYKRAFVHFSPGKWNEKDEEACTVLKALQEGGTVKIVYDDPWFWKISLSRAKKPAEAPKPKSRPTVQIDSEGAAGGGVGARKKPALLKVQKPASVAVKGGD